MADPTLQLPVINLNGTSARSLLEDNRGTWLALDAARKAMANATPNARDYQTADPNTYQVARAQHIARLESISKIQADLDTIAEYLTDHVK